MGKNRTIRIFKFEMRKEMRADFSTVKINNFGLFYNNTLKQSSYNLVLRTNHQTRGFFELNRHV